MALGKYPYVPLAPARESNVKGRIAAPLLLAAVVLVSIFSFYAHQYLQYVPYGDDPAVLVASAGNPTDWFTYGFSQYFIVYPEWSVPVTDFLRPGVNGIIRLYEIFFSQHYVLYFAGFYVAQFVLVWLVLLMAREMRISQRILLLLAFLLAINPAFFDLGLTSIAFQFDLWCGLFAVAALFCLSRKRFVFAVIFLVLAVFTKEAALYAPVAAALTVVLTTRRRFLAATMLLPLLAWASVRKFVFAGSSQGLYAVPVHSTRALVLGIVKGVSQWPTGLVPDLGVKRILTHHDLLHNLSTIVLLAANALFWVLLIGLGIQLLRKGTGGDLAPLTIYLWLCGALSFGVLVGPDPRFGGSIYPLELLLLAMVSVALPISRWRTASTTALCLLVPIFVWHMYAAPLEYDANDRFLMQELNGALKRNGTNAGNIYILNSAPAFSAPRYLASLAGVTARVVVLNQFDGCLSSHEALTFLTQREDLQMSIAIQLPSCAHFVWDNVEPSVLAGALSGAQFPRKDLAIYSLPSAHVVGQAVRDVQVQEVDSGKRLNITLTSFVFDSSILLYYDWNDKTYHCIGRRCAASS